MVKFAHVFPDLRQCLRLYGAFLPRAYFVMCMLSPPNVEKADGKYGHLKPFASPDALRHGRCLLIPACVFLEKGRYTSCAFE